jgi:hypothetical protein
LQHDRWWGGDTLTCPRIILCMCHHRQCDFAVWENPRCAPPPMRIPRTVLHRLVTPPTDERCRHAWHLSFLVRVHKRPWPVVPVDVTPIPYVRVLTEAVSGCSAFSTTSSATTTIIYHRSPYVPLLFFFVIGVGTGCFTFTAFVLRTQRSRPPSTLALYTGIRIFGTWHDCDLVLFLVFSPLLLPRATLLGVHVWPTSHIIRKNDSFRTPFRVSWTFLLFQTWADNLHHVLVRCQACLLHFCLGTIHAVLHVRYYKRRGDGCLFPGALTPAPEIYGRDGFQNTRYQQFLICVYITSTNNNRRIVYIIYMTKLSVDIMRCAKIQFMENALFL